MKCRKCGYPLNEDDKFCRKCGARVIKRPLAAAAAYRAAHSKDREEEERAFKGYTPPEEKFDWDINEFPTEHRRTEEVNFDWNTFDEFHKEHHSDGDEIAFAPEPERHEITAEKPGIIEESPAGPEMWTPQQEPYEEESDVQPQAIEEPMIEEEPVGPEMWTPEDSNEPTGPLPDDITGEDLEKEIFDEIKETEPEDNENLKRQTAKIDKFYTFNKKNEEFQRLLDREYEKYREGLPPDEPEERAELDETRGIIDKELPQKDTEQPDQIKEMAEARSSLFEEKIIPPPEEKPKEPDKLEEHDESKKPEEPGESEKKDRGKKIGLTVLAAVVIVILVLVAIRLAAPDSPISKQIDRIPAFFTGEQQEPVAEETDRTVPAVDLTGVIQGQTDQNIDGAIDMIRYNAALGYDEAAVYPDKDIKAGKALTTNIFYKGEDGTEYYIDDAVVGAAIYYASTGVKSGSKLDSFEIGEIRKGSNGYYVWVSLDDKKEIFKVTENEQKMSVTKVYDL